MRLKDEGPGKISQQPFALKFMRLRGSTRAATKVVSIASIRHYCAGRTTSRQRVRPADDDAVVLACARAGFREGMDSGHEGQVQHLPDLVLVGGVVLAVRTGVEHCRGGLQASCGGHLLVAPDSGRDVG